MTTSRSPSYWRLKLGAIGWLVLGSSRRAEDLFDRMLQSWPSDAYALASRAHQHAQAGRTCAAIADAQALVAAHPRRCAADWFNLAFLLESADRPAEAEPAFRQALAMDAELDRAWYGLGLTLVRLGRHEEAQAALVRNTELQPMSPYGWVQLARVHVARHEPDEARRIVHRIQRFEPGVATQLRRDLGLAP